jgi:hypothetical protein
VFVLRCTDLRLDTFVRIASCNNADNFDNLTTTRIGSSMTSTCKSTQVRQPFEAKLIAIAGRECSAAARDKLVFLLQCLYEYSVTGHLSGSTPRPHTVLLVHHTPHTIFSPQAPHRPFLNTYRHYNLSPTTGPKPLCRRRRSSEIPNATHMISAVPTEY